MGRFILSIAVALAVAAPGAVWAADYGMTTPPAQTAPAKPKTVKARKPAPTPAARRLRKTTGGPGAAGGPTTTTTTTTPR